ncbi:MAG: hypothetical protein WB424_17965, partial [Terracidiphilus sp.]
MRNSFIDTQILSENILPSEWRTDPSVQLTLFNPTLTSLPKGGFALAYRAVGSDGLRRIGVCRLNEQLSLIAHTIVPFSDRVRPEDGRNLPLQAARWFADPRLVWWQEHLYIYWNSGINHQANYQFLQRVNVDSLEPEGPCFALEYPDGRHTIEKNWSLFEYQGELFAFYTLSPAVVLQATEITSSKIIFSKVDSIPWHSGPYTSHFGELRGGASPLRIGQNLYVLFHSAWRPMVRYRYAAGLLVMASKPPFQPLSWIPMPISLPNPFGRIPHPNPFIERQRLNGTVAEVIYPAGTSLKNGKLLV